MKIVLICAGGITTNILAKKMARYGQENGYDDEIRAFSLGNYEDEEPEADLVLVAPQARGFLKRIEEMTERLGAQVCLLEEEDIILVDPGRLYRRLEPYRSQEQKTAPPEPVALTPGLVAQVMRKSLCAILPLLAGMLLIRLLQWASGSELLFFLDQAIGGVAAIYVIFAVGYHFGAELREEPLTYAILSLACCFMMLSVSGKNTMPEFLFGINNTFIPIRALGPASCLYYVVFSLLASTLYCVVHRRLHFQVPYELQMFESMLPCGVTFSFFFVIRICAEFAGRCFAG